MWREIRLEATEQAFFVVQTGDSIEQAKVFKAHAVLQGLCANFVNALKLLANQQEDGDDLLQNIVKDLGRREKVSRTACENSLRLTMRAPMLDRYAGARVTFQVRKPKVPEGGSDVIVRENPDELTLRADEVGTLKAYINVDHVAKERWGPSLVDHDWHAFCQALYVKASKEKIGKKCMSLTKK